MRRLISTSAAAKRRSAFSSRSLGKTTRQQPGRWRRRPAIPSRRSTSASIIPRAWYEAIIARAAGDEEKARAAFGATRKILEQRLTIKPNDARTIAVLAQVDAGLGRKEEAIAEGRRAVEMMPLSRDAYDGMLVLQGLAQVYTWTGETDKALELVRQLMTIPGYLTYGYLKVDPSWNPLRGDPRFRTICRLARAVPSVAGVADPGSRRLQAEARSTRESVSD